jgi:hypothetical protein
MSYSKITRCTQCNEVQLPENITCCGRCTHMHCNTHKDAVCDTLDWELYEGEVETFEDADKMLAEFREISGVPDATKMCQVCMEEVDEIISGKIDDARNARDKELTTKKRAASEEPKAKQPDKKKAKKSKE